MRLRVYFGLILLVLITACSATGPETATPDADPVTPETSSTPPDSGEPDANPPEGSQADPPAEPARTDPPPAPPAPPSAPEPEREPVAPDPVDPGPHPGLLDPAEASEKAPELFRAKFETTGGDVVLEIHRDWAPRGADRFYNLVKIGFFSDIAIFRVIQQPNPFMAQFGIHGDPKISAVWDKARIQDDPVGQSNSRGRITFATSGPNTRTTQFFISFSDNSFLDGQGFSPFGEVVEGMDVVDAFNSEYGEGPPRGMGPNQGLLTRQGNSYLKQQYPRLDYIKKASIVE